MSTNFIAMLLWLISLLVFFLVISTMSLHAHAESFPPLYPERTGGEREPIDEFISEYADDEEKSEFILPNITSQDSAKLSKQLFVEVREIRVLGNTVFDDYTIHSLTAPYENREISADDLQALRRRITDYYHHHGYINSFAIVPDQDIERGIIILHIIEGTLTQVRVKGNDSLRSEYVEKHFPTSQSKPLNINQLQEEILILHQDRRINRLSANLELTKQLDKAILDIKVEEARPYDLGVSINNYRSPSIGEKRAAVWGIHYNMLGYGDTLQFRYGKTSGSKDSFLSYAFPFNESDSSLEIYFQESKSEIIEKPFDVYDIRNHSQQWGVNYRYTLSEKVHEKLDALISYNVIKSKSYLLGIPFSFSPGSHNGVSKSSVVGFGIEWKKSNSKRLFFLSSSINFGLDDFNDESSEDVLSYDNFMTWSLQFQFIKKLPKYDANLIVKQHLQIANKALPSIEKMGIGGIYSVRGYRENYLLSDSGLTNSIEIRMPLRKFSFEIGNKTVNNTLDMSIFYDSSFGVNQNEENRSSSYSNFIHSIGLGIHWSVSDILRCQIVWAKKLKDEYLLNGSSLQEDGFHFSLNVNY